MIGFPGETLEEIKSTIRLVKKVRPTVVQLHIFTPFPGTEFYQELKNKDMIRADEWLYGDPLNFNYPHIRTMSNKAFKKLAVRLFKELDLYNLKNARQPFNIKHTLIFRLYRKFKIFFREAFLFLNRTQ